MIGRVLTLLTALFAWAMGSCEGDVVELAPVADTTLFEMNPDTNFGAEDQLIVGSVARNAPQHRARLLLRFDLSAVPPGSVVTNVNLDLTVLKENSGEPPAAMEVRPMMVTWREGDRTGMQGASALPGQSTWNSRAHLQVAWSVPGGQAGSEFGSVSSSIVSLDGVGSYRFPETPALIGEVQSWVDFPATNFGWVIMGMDESIVASARRVASRESVVGRPRLTVGYTRVAAPLVRFDSIQAASSGLELRFRAVAGNVYSVWFRDDLRQPSWQTLTNVSSKLLDTEVLVRDSVGVGARFYQLAIIGQVD